MSALRGSQVYNPIATQQAKTILETSFEIGMDNNQILATGRPENHYESAFCSDLLSDYESEPVLLALFTGRRK